MRESDTNPYEAPHTTGHAGRSRSSFRLGLLLIGVNFVYHGSLLAWVRIEDSWIEFEDWYRVLACYIPVFATGALAALPHGRGLAVFIAVAVSILLAVLHGILLDIAAAIV